MKWTAPGGQKASSNQEGAKWRRITKGRSAARTAATSQECLQWSGERRPARDTPNSGEGAEESGGRRAVGRAMSREEYAK